MNRFGVSSELKLFATQSYTFHFSRDNNAQFSVCIGWLTTSVFGLPIQLAPRVDNGGWGRGWCSAPMVMTYSVSSLRSKNGYQFKYN